MSPWTEIGIILLLTMLSGLFSGAEISMLSVRKTRLRELAEHGNEPAKAALRLRETPERLLATIQIGITFIGATTAVFGGSRLEAPLAAALARLGLGQATSSWLAFALVIMLVSYLSLVIGELVPKSIALQVPERFALLVATPLAALAVLGRPLVWLLTVSSNAILRPFNDRATFSESRLSPEELQQLVEESSSAGVLHGEAGEIASRALDLAALRAKALMIPRRKIVSLDLAATRAEVLRVLRDTPHARYPVHEEQMERVRGYVLARDVYEAILIGEFELKPLVRRIPFFPASTPAIDVLRAFQAAKQQLGLLVDEQGGIVGLITIEDIAEDLIGEILEEHESPPRLVWREASSGCFGAMGEAPIHEVSRMLGEDLGEHAAATTLAGLVAEKAGRVPLAGERVEVGTRVGAEVLEATPRQVVRLRLCVRQEDETSPERGARAGT